MHNVTIDETTKTIRPVTREGDEYFGLRVGTNGTGATMRRVLVTPAGYDWRCADGRHAVGITLRPDAAEVAHLGEATNPWDGFGPDFVEATLYAVSP